MEIQKVHGQHNGIQLITNGEGEEVYYSTRSKKCAIGIKGLSRQLGCGAESISKQLVKFGKFKEAEMYTLRGIKLVKLVVEDDLNDFYSFMLKSRMKQATKDRILEVQGKYVQAGFRLSVLLRIAPEQVAHEAINHIESVEKAEQVAEDASIHAQLLRSHIAINYEAEQNELKAGKIVGENNLAVGLPYKGHRANANVMQKATLTTTQLGQSAALNKMRKSDKNYDESDKYETCSMIRDAQAKLKNAIDEMIAEL